MPSDLQFIRRLAVSLLLTACGAAPEYQDGSPPPLCYRTEYGAADGWASDLCSCEPDHGATLLDGYGVDTGGTDALTVRELAASCPIEAGVCCYRTTTTWFAAGVGVSEASDCLCVQHGPCEYTPFIYWASKRAVPAC